jgi:hypothetical protein
MIPSDDTPDQPDAAAEPPDDEATGLPWLRSWRSVYALVVACFIAYVVLLVVLKQAFS